MIYDSDGEEYPLEAIFDKFDNQCEYLRNKPKIYFVDACRGEERSKRHYEKDTTNNLHNSSTQLATIPSNVETDNINHNEIIKFKGKNGDNDDVDDNKQSISDKSNTVKNSKPTSWMKHEGCLYVYGNTSGFKVIDGGKKGGYLIRSFTKVIADEDQFHNELNEIIQTVRYTLEHLIGKGEYAYWPVR